MGDLSLRDQLIAWSNINSGSSNLAGLERMLAALHAAFSTLPGAKAEMVPLPGTTARALRVTSRPSAPIRVLLSGHYDTVFSADDPFQRAEQFDADTLRGPGVIDMKGGLVVMLAALRALEASPEAGGLGWEVLLTPDEETGSVASRAMLESAAKRHLLGLIFEPARENGAIVKSRKGTGIFTLTCRGRAAHAGRPQDGRNAIAALAECLVSLHQLPGRCPGVLVNIGSVRGGGAVNIVPEFAEAEVNVRITQASDVERVQAHFRDAMAAINARDGFHLEITGAFNRLPLEATPAVESWFAHWRECAREAGVPGLDWVHVGGGSDGNLLAAAGLPCLDGLGPIGGHLHSPEEFVLLSSLEPRAEIAARFLIKLASGGIRPLPAR